MEKDLNITRGDNRTFKLTVKDKDNNNVSIVGATTKFTIRKNIGTKKLIEKSSTVESQIVLTDAENGEYQVFFVPADTINLLGDYKYDSEVTTALNKVYTVVKGTFTILSDIT